MVEQSKASIEFEETHYIKVSLNEFQRSRWSSGEGKIRLAIPLDKKSLKGIDSEGDILDLGKIILVPPTAKSRLEQEIGRVDHLREDDERIDFSALESVQLEGTHIESNFQKDQDKLIPLHITLKQDGAWDRLSKSAKQQLVDIHYVLKDAPSEGTLISVAGQVLDFDEFPPFNRHEIAFQNDLRLQLDLWIPKFDSFDTEEELKQIQHLLLERESNQQIFFNSGNLKKQDLTKALVALANTSGGTIIIGVNESGSVSGISEADIDRITKVILNAALTPVPPIPLRKVKLLKPYANRKVYLIRVPMRVSASPHLFNGREYVRKYGKTTTGESENFETKANVKRPPGYAIGDLVSLDPEGNLVKRNRTQVTIITPVKVLGQSFVTWLSNYKLGKYLSALVDRPGVVNIVLDQLSSNQDMKKLEEYINGELELMAPKLELNYLERATHEDRSIVFVQFQSISSIHTYKEDAYAFINDQLVTTDPKIGLERFISDSGEGQSGNDISLSIREAYIEWKGKPAQLNSEFANDLQPLYDQTRYNGQNQVVIWDNDEIQLKEDEGGTGYDIQLKLPLNNISLIADELGHVSVTEDLPDLKARIRIGLENLIVSGHSLAFSFVPDAEWPYLKKLPVSVRTILDLEIDIEPSRLFKHRRPLRSQMQFYLPNIALDEFRARDISFACADVGFRHREINRQIAEDFGLKLYGIPGFYLYKPVNTEGEVGLEKSNIIKDAMFFALKKNQYHDISLQIELNCDVKTISRTKIYENIQDIDDDVETYNLGIKVTLIGRGEGVGMEISQLQIQLFDYLSQRLQQLVLESL